MKRRDFLTLTGLGGFGLSLVTHKLLAQESTPNNKQQPILRFVAIADTGTGNEGQYAVAQAMNDYSQKNPFSLVLLAGDNIYNEGEIEKIKAVFEKPYKPFLAQKIPFYAVLGNHDIRTNNGEDQLRYPLFNMPSRYYSFSQEKVQFFALDTNVNADWSQQLPWLENNLANSDKPWKIVYGHHPLYSSGMHGTDKNLISKLAPIFNKYKVALYICGHDHNYERTVPMEKTTYIITGGGCATRPVERSPWTAYSEAKLSFTAYEVYENHLETKAIGIDGKVFDQGKINILSLS